MEEREFKEILEREEVRALPIRRCAICEEPVRFLFAHVAGEFRAFFDGGCGCANFGNYDPRSWEDILQYVNGPYRPEQEFQGLWDDLTKP